MKMFRGRGRNFHLTMMFATCTAVTSASPGNKALGQVVPMPVFDAAKAEAHGRTIEATIDQIAEIERKIAEHRRLVKTLERNAKKADQFFFSSIPVLTAWLEKRQGTRTRRIAASINELHEVHRILTEDCEQSRQCSVNKARAIQRSLSLINNRMLENATTVLKDSEIRSKEFENEAESVVDIERENHRANGEMAALDSANQQAAKEAEQLARLRVQMLQAQEAKALELQEETHERSNATRRLNRFREHREPTK